MEVGDLPPRQRIKGGSANRLAERAVIASIRKITGDRAAFVVASDDVIDLEGHAGRSLRHAAILAPPACPLPHQSL